MLMVMGTYRQEQAFARIKDELTRLTVLQLYNPQKKVKYSEYSKYSKKVKVFSGVTTDVSITLEKPRICQGLSICHDNQ